MKLNINDMGALLSRPTPVSCQHRPSGREVAAQNEVAVLLAIRDYGHLRTADVAAAVWPTEKYGEQLAQRTLKRLLAGGYVLRRVNTLASSSWVLASAGASRLELYGGEASHGRDIVGVAGATFVHRTLASAFLIRKSTAEGVAVFGEYAIAHGRAPASKQAMSKRFGKLPDGLVIRGKIVDWIEVEASAKPMNDLKAVLKPAEWFGLPFAPGQSLTLGQLIIVFDRRQEHGRRILKAAHDRWLQLSHSEQQKLRGRIVLAQADVSTPLRIRGFTETRLSEYRPKP